MGRWQTTGEDPDKVTNHRIAIEIPFSFLVKTGERGEPIELQEERDLTIAESIRAGAKTHDALPLARRKPGEQTEAWFAGGLKSLAAVGGGQSAEPVQICNGGHTMVSVETEVRELCSECGAQVEIDTRVYECRTCWPTVRRCSGCLSAEANNPPRSAGSAAEEKKERKRAKKQRQQAERSPEEQYEVHKSKTMREYSFYFRIAFATIMKCPIDYYSAPDEMWTPPEPGTPYSDDDVVKMVVKGSGLEFPYPDATVHGRRRRGAGDL